jgi:hypothetical protein
MGGIARHPRYVASSSRRCLFVIYSSKYSHHPPNESFRDKGIPIVVRIRYVTSFSRYIITHYFLLVLVRFRHVLLTILLPQRMNLLRQSAFPAAVTTINPERRGAGGSEYQPETFDHVLIDANQFLHTTLRRAYNRRAKRSTTGQQHLDDEIIDYSLILFIKEINRITTTTAIPRKSLVIAIGESCSQRTYFGLFNYLLNIFLDRSIV